MAANRGHAPKRLGVFAFEGAGDPLAGIEACAQRDYLRCYLHDLNVRWTLEEANYFDRDYLAAFKAFYGESARGYANVCRRIAFFTDAGCSSPNEFRALLEAAAGGAKDSRATLQEHFVGFTVLRPIRTRLGRTVLAWYPDDRPGVLPRIVAPCRGYEINIAGVQLTVDGLAWQQQDSAVAACATVGLWSMLQSSAFRDRVALPTTAAITESAHRTASLGERVFPSSGLYNHHLLEAIKGTRARAAPCRRRSQRRRSAGLLDRSVREHSGDAAAVRLSDPAHRQEREGRPRGVCGRLQTEDSETAEAWRFRRRGRPPWCNSTFTTISAVG